MLKEVNNRLKQALQSKNRESFFAGGSIIVYNSQRQEIISYGDCNYVIGWKKYYTKKENDIRLAKKRSNIIKKALKEGKKQEDIMKEDIGRKEILEELINSLNYANCKCDYGYPVLNGEKIVEDFIKITKVKKGKIVILSSDGYPKLLSSLAKTENHLKNMIKKDLYVLMC